MNIILYNNTSDLEHVESSLYNKVVELLNRKSMNNNNDWGAYRYASQM